MMRALSLTRPWPELILRCGKPIENRTWSTGYRGPVLLHAARSWQASALDLAEDIEVLLDRDLCVSEVSWHADDHPLGIVGVAELVSVCVASVRDSGQLRCDCGPWAFPGQCHWRLANPLPLAEPVPCRGALGLWTPPADVATACLDQLPTAAAAAMAGQ